MRNNFCRLCEPELKKLDPHVPADLMGMLWSPFHMNERNGYIWVPVDSFQHITHFLTDHAEYLTALKKAAGAALPARMEVCKIEAEAPSEYYEHGEAEGHNKCLDAAGPLVAGLLARVAELEKDKERLDAIESNCWDIRYESSAIGDTGDYSTSIEVVGQWMEKPQERVIGENYNENLRAAIDQAMKADAYPPARPEYPEIDDALSAYEGREGE